MLYAVTKVEELSIDESEAKELARAAQNVARHYDVAASQKSLDWANFVGAMCMVYGTRLYAFRNRKRAEAARPVDGDVRAHAAQGAPGFGVIDGGTP